MNRASWPRSTWRWPSRLAQDAGPGGVVFPGEAPRSGRRVRGPQMIPVLYKLVRHLRKAPVGTQAVGFVFTPPTLIMRGARSSRFQDGNLPAAQQAAAHHAGARLRRGGAALARIGCATRCPPARRWASATRAPIHTYGVLPPPFISAVTLAGALARREWRGRTVSGCGQHHGPGLYVLLGGRGARLLRHR